MVEWKTEEGFTGDAGVSYLFKNELGSMLFDVGFGPTRPAFTQNADKLGFNLNQVDALTISHLHCDHMGGLSAQRSRKVAVPEKLMPKKQTACFLPDKAGAEGFDARLVQGPQLLTAGIASTGNRHQNAIVLLVAAVFHDSNITGTALQHGINGGTENITSTTTATMPPHYQELHALFPGGFDNAAWNMSTVAQC